MSMLSAIGVYLSRFPCLPVGRSGVCAVAALACLGVNGAAAMTLVEAVGLAIETHPTVRATEASERAAKEEISDARADFFPSIDLRADTGPQYVNNTTTRGRSTRGSGDGPGINTWRKGGELIFTQRLFDGFDARYRTSSAEKRALAAGYKVFDAKETIGLRAVQAYLAVMRNRLVLRLAKENMRIHVDVLQDVKVKVEKGGGNLGDMNQAESRLALAQARSTQIQGDLRDSETRFLEAVGSMPVTLDEPRNIADTLPKDFREAIAAAVSNNPTLKAVSVTADSRQADAKAAESPFWPSVNLEVSENRDWDADGIRENTTNRKALIVLRYNFFKGGRDRARRKRTMELASMAKEKEFETHRLVERQMRIDYNAFLTARDRMPPLKKRALASAEALISYQLQFKLGRRSLLDVLDVENELFQSKVALVDGEIQLRFSQYQVLTTKGALLKTLGVPDSQTAPGSENDVSSDAGLN